MKRNPSILEWWPSCMALFVCFVAMIGTSFTALAQPAEFAFTPTNASGTFYGQVTVNGAPANANDWLAAFDDWGNCAGASQVVMNDGVAYINLPIYGDDMTTSTVDEGITGDEPFTLQLWRAASGNILTYPGFDAIILFEGWSNTNGAPMPGYDDPDVVYDFGEVAQPPSISGPATTCIDADPFAPATSPAGGVLVGPGIVGDLFDPALAGEGTHVIDYLVDFAIASWTVEVLPSFDATILTEGPFCANDSPVALEAATQGGTWTGNGVFDGVFDPAFVAPGTITLTYEVGSPGETCYDTDQQAITVYPSPGQPILELAQPSPGVFHGVVLFPDDNFVYEWLDPFGNLLATGDTLLNPEEGVFLIQVTNNYGCTDAWEDSFVFPGVFDFREFEVEWLSPSMLRVAQGLAHVSLWDLQGREVWTRALNGAATVDLPLAAGQGWRLITLELTDGRRGRVVVVR